LDARVFLTPTQGSGGVVLNHDTDHLQQRP
jgi:hypothetical protein